MKSTIRNAAILGCLMLATASFAQDKAAQKQSATAHTVQPKQQEAPAVLFSADQMTQDLGLNADQSEKLKSIENDMNQREMKLEKLDPKERDAKTAELWAERRKMVASVLTPEQNKKLDAMTRKAAEDRKTEKMRTNIGK